MLSLGTLDRKVRWSSVVACWLNGKGFGLGLGLGHGPGNALAVLFFLSGLISVVNTRFGSLRKYAMVYLWFHVTWLVTSVPWIE